MSVAKRLLIRGRVQGVCFRASTREVGRQLGLEGWARNLPDGRVEVWAQGEPAEVARLVDWCRHGPELAVVTDVEVDEIEPDRSLAGQPFGVRY